MGEASMEEVTTQEREREGEGERERTMPGV